ncbi:GNAT family N-acetyltransferase [Rhodococcus sp. IC4_135]|uniref:GNAT family N-acetyltransferase n=1 Tax=Rhodococcus sp. IC4_135 TaxID=2715537 RepID=UPI0014237F35|nr:GNAT family N-acetyltransferase [Rhodococcus sp. IC4_135]
MIVDVVRAVDTDGPEILALRHSAEDWLAERGIIQWHPREITLEQIRAQISRGEFFVARDRAQSRIVGALRLIWSDPAVWPDSDEPAGYVHGLVIDRAFSGTSMGERLLGWALRPSAEEGAQYLRLDCVETNVRLRRYYRDAGFVEVGRRDFGDVFDNGWFSVVLFERSLT